MASTREDERRLSIGTLLIASFASLAAALITSRFWIAGTPLAAALTPVIVAIVSEMLHRPTQAIAKRVTTEGTAILPQATGAGPPAGQHDEPTRTTSDLEDGAREVRVYRSEPRRWGRIHPTVVVATAVLAFAIAAAALTLPELIAGQSLGKGDRNTTLFGGRDRDDKAEPKAPEQTAPEETTPEETTPSEETTPQETTPPEETTPAPEEPPLTVPTAPQEAPPPE